VSKPEPSSLTGGRRRGSIEHFVEMGVFSARWLMAPFYIGLIGMLMVLLVVFAVEFAHGVVPALQEPEEAIMLVLSLIDLSLAGNLLLIVIFSGYENFVSKIDTRGHEDRPEWMGTVDFSGMKLKLIGSIVAISAISLLRSFMRLSQAGDEAAGGQPVEVHYDQLLWMVILHVVFVASGVLFALMDFVAVRSQKTGIGNEGRAA
jgi:uncharacterized protein (TIGR00645 family)